MTAPQSSTTTAPSLRRDVLGAARHHLGNRWALLALAGLAVGVGLVFGGWAWLVAIGAAPIILSTLPCLIMCGFGVCAMCRFGKSESASSSVADCTLAVGSARETTKVDARAVTVASCCQGAIIENPANALTDESPQSKEEAHA